MSMSGRWRIVEMDLWDAEAIDLLGPAFIEFGRDGSGAFRFIAVKGWIDFRHGVEEGRVSVEFSWDGDDEGDPVSGRGWAVLEEDGSLSGRMYFQSWRRLRIPGGALRSTSPPQLPPTCQYVATTAEAVLTTVTSGSPQARRQPAPATLGLVGFAEVGLVSVDALELIR
jgi:hypothetical protein